MLKSLKRKSLYASAAIFTGMVSGIETASAGGGGGGNSFGNIGNNIIDSIADLPGLLTGLSYMLGILLGVLGILKIKEHVEQPTQTQLKDGAIRLGAGGGLFALPIVYEAMKTTIGDGANVEAAELNKVDFAVN